MSFPSSTRIVLRTESSSYRAIISPNPTADPQYHMFMVESLDVPDTYYQFDDVQTVVFIDSTATPNDLVFEPGFWDVTSFTTELTAQMTAADIVIYTFAVNSVTGRVEISSSGPASFSLILPPIISKYYGLGYKETQVDSVNDVIELGVPDFTRTKCFYVYNSQKNVGDGAYYGDPNRTPNMLPNIPFVPNINEIAVTPENNLIGAFPVTVDGRYYGTRYPIAHTSFIIGTWNLQLKDEEGELLLLNGHAWTLVIILC